MTDSSISGLILTFAIDCLVFLCLFLVFLLSRNARSRTSDDPDPANPPRLNEHGLSLVGGIRSAFQYSYQEMVEVYGKDVAAYQSIKFYIVVILSVLAFFGWLPLIVLYSQGETEVKEDAEEISIGHVLGESDMLVGPVLCLLLFSAVLYHFLLKVYMKTQGKSSHITTETDKLSPEGRNVVLVYGIPKELVGDNDSRRLLHFVRGFDNRAASVYIVPEYSQAYALLQQINALKDKKRIARLNEAR
jgi:hypothetical protein